MSLSEGQVTIIIGLIASLATFAVGWGVVVSQLANMQKSVSILFPKVEKHDRAIARLQQHCADLHGLGAPKDSDA